MDNNKPQLENHVIKPRLSIFENGMEYRLISLESEMNLDNGIIAIEDYMRTHNGFGLSDTEMDQLYGNAKSLWGAYATTLRDVKFSFHLKRKQFRYITELLRDKLEYDVNTIFLAIELTNMLGTWSKESTAKDDTTMKSYETDATEITYMYHLIAKHKVKGLGDNSYLFAEVLRRIGEISKVINYYDTSAKNLSSEIQKWVASFEPELTEMSPDQSVEAKVIKPKRSSKKEETDSKAWDLTQ